MEALLVASEVAAKEATMTVPLKRRAALLTAHSVVVAYSFEVLARTHRYGWLAVAHLASL
jgi:hypothetical protein